MYASTTLSLTAITISIIGALISLSSCRISYLSYKQVIISRITNQLSKVAQECNKFIDLKTQGHPTNTQEVSAVVSTIINGKSQLELNYKIHKLLLMGYDQENFIALFNSELHTSIRELIKNKLPDGVNDMNLRDIIKKQQIVCREFLKQHLN